MLCYKGILISSRPALTPCNWSKLLACLQLYVSFKVEAPCWNIAVPHFTQSFISSFIFSDFVKFSCIIIQKSENSPLHGKVTLNNLAEKKAIIPPKASAPQKKHNKTKKKNLLLSWKNLRRNQTRGGWLSASTGWGERRAEREKISAEKQQTINSRQAGEANNCRSEGNKRYLQKGTR